MNNTIEDISKVTTVPRITLQKLLEKSEMCVCHNILEQILRGETYICTDILFGELHLNIDDNEVKFKFIPSSQFEDMLVKTISEQRSPLITAVEDGLAENLLNVYKELF